MSPTPLHSAAALLKIRSYVQLFSSLCETGLKYRACENKSPSPFCKIFTNNLTHGCRLSTMCLFWESLVKQLNNSISRIYWKWSLKATDVHVAIFPLVFYLYSGPLVRTNVPSDLWPKLLEQFKQIFWLQSITMEHSVTIKGWKSCLFKSLLWLSNSIILRVVWKGILMWHITGFTIFLFNA